MVISRRRGTTKDEGRTSEARSGTESLRIARGKFPTILEVFTDAHCRISGRLSHFRPI